MSTPKKAGQGKRYGGRGLGDPGQGGILGMEKGQGQTSAPGHQVSQVRRALEERERRGGQVLRWQGQGRRILGACVCGCVTIGELCVGLGFLRLGEQ